MDDFVETPQVESAAPTATGAGSARRLRDPAATLNWAMAVYIFINLLYGLPLAAAPNAFFRIVGLEEAAALQLGGFRWFGAALLAWAISGILVLARPGGRAIFVTAGAFQLTMAAVALLYSWSVSEYQWSTWFHAVTTLIMVGGAAYLVFARMAGRKVLRAG